MVFNRSKGSNRYLNFSGPEPLERFERLERLERFYSLSFATRTGMLVFHAKRPTLTFRRAFG
jgi:hypothetical protein